jgi:hypothetical protein
MAAVLMVSSSVTPRLIARRGTRQVLVLGLSLVAVAMMTLAVFASADGGYWALLPGLLLAGAGLGLSMTPSTTAITGALPEDAQGVASALNDTTRELGGAIGVALLGSLLNSGHRSGGAGLESPLLELHLDDELDLDGRVARQRSHADRRPRMLAGCAEHLAEQLAGAVHHRWLVDVAGGAGHEADHLDHPLDEREVTDLSVYGGERVERAQPGAVLGGVGVHLRADEPGRVQLAVGEGQLTGRVDEVARADRRDVVSHRRDHRWQRETELGEALLRGRHAGQPFGRFR